eukprot:4288969-Pyramimonas_sp.AAC.1
MMKLLPPDARLKCCGELLKIPSCFWSQWCRDGELILHFQDDRDMVAGGALGDQLETSTCLPCDTAVANPWPETFRNGEDIQC